MFELGSTRWTSTVPTPFGPAPGAGLSEGLTRHQRRVANMAFESGFAAEPVGAEFTAQEERVLGRGPFKVKKIPVTQGQIPSALIQFYFTDRGTLSKEKLDRGIWELLQRSNVQTSKGTKLELLPVTWRWQHDRQADFYYPVAATPAVISGMRYAGNILLGKVPGAPAYSPDPEVMAKLPVQIYVYTLAATSPEGTMSDAEAAKILTLLKQAMVNTLPPSDAYANVYVTLLGSPPEVFGSGKLTPDISNAGLSPVAKVGFSAMVLIAAINLLTPHIGANPT